MENGTFASLEDLDSTRLNKKINTRMIFLCTAVFNGGIQHHPCLYVPVHTCIRYEVFFSHTMIPGGGHLCHTDILLVLILLLHHYDRFESVIEEFCFSVPTPSTPTPV